MTQSQAERPEGRVALEPQATHIITAIANADEALSCLPRDRVDAKQCLIITESDTRYLVAGLFATLP
jgi:hypothetical protein